MASAFRLPVGFPGLGRRTARRAAEYVYNDSLCNAYIFRIDFRASCWPFFWAGRVRCHRRRPCNRARSRKGPNTSN